MLQLVIFLKPKCIYIFPSFEFHHFWELLVDEIKREYIINNSKHRKQNSLGLLQIPHMQINVALHSNDIRVGMTFFSLTPFLPKQYCFSSPFYRNQVWHFKLIHTDSVQMKRYNVFFWSQSFVQSWLNCTLAGIPTSLGWNQEIDYLAHKTLTFEVLSMFLPALLKKEVEKAMKILAIVIKWK